MKTTEKNENIKKKSKYNLVDYTIDTKTMALD